MSGGADIIDFIRDALDRRTAAANESLRRSLHPPFYKVGSCFGHDVAGNDLDWSLYCNAAWQLTGALVDDSARGAVIGNAMLLSGNIALTAARVVRGRDASRLRLRFSSENGRTGRSVNVKAVRMPRTDVLYGDPLDFIQARDQDSSDIALVLLADNSASMPYWLAPGGPPDRVTMEALNYERNGRCTSGAGTSAVERCLREWSDAGLFSYYDENHEYGTPIQWGTVSYNGSVILATTDYLPGDTNHVVGGEYAPARDRGAPVIFGGKVVGVVSGSLGYEEGGAGVTIYRITRLDRWAMWISKTIGELTGTAPVPLPVAPPPGTPATQDARVATRGTPGWLPFAVVLGLGAGIGIGLAGR